MPDGSTASPACASLPLLAAVLVLLVFGCSKRPSVRELEALRAEAVTQNAALERRYGAGRVTWTLSVVGQATPLELDLQHLDALATTHVRTSSPVWTRDTHAVLDYRGVLVSHLLELAHADPAARTVTFVASDGYLSTISTADLRRYPILLSVAREGRPIARAEGGPLLLTFPETEFPDVRARFNETAWAFYTTYLIVGRERPRIDVDGTVLDESALAALPSTSGKGYVKYRFGWPSTPVATRGPLLGEVLKAAGAHLGPGARVAIHGKDRASGANHWVMDGDAALHCGAYLASRWGDPPREIPASMGGPLVLVLPAACHFPDANWPVFVSRLHVEPGAAHPVAGAP